MNSTGAESRRNLSIDPLIARKKLEAASTLNRLHWFIICGSLILTFIAWYFSKSELDARVNAQFDREADQVVELVLERMRKYEDALWSGVAFTSSTDDEIAFNHWKRYAESIRIEQTYPGINGIGIIHSVNDASLPEYLKRQREQRPEYNIHPQRRGELYLPISYIIPVTGNEKAVGLDMVHEKNRYTAAVKARDTGTAQITGPITLVQDSEKTPGFLFYAPFYRGHSGTRAADRSASFAGMVYAPFVMKKLMEGTLEKERRQVGIRISDGSEQLYNELVDSVSDYDPSPMLTREVESELYGRKWKFEIWSSKSFRESSTDNQPITILIGGIVIDSLLILLFISISRSSHQALSYADAMTHKLHENSVELEEKANELETSNQNLSRFNEVARGRELRMVELKEEVNEVLVGQGKSPKYVLKQGETE